MIIVEIDGAARPNPGKGGIGIVIRGDSWDYTLSENLPGKVTNNQAEYCALIRALVELMRNNCFGKQIEVISDSEMLVSQMNYEREVDKGGSYVPNYLKAKKLAGYFSNIKFHWVSRKENNEANLLASNAVSD